MVRDDHDRSPRGGARPKARDMHRCSLTGEPARPTMPQAKNAILCLPSQAAARFQRRGHRKIARTIRMVYRRTERADRVRDAARQKLLRAAQELFSSHGYEATTIQQIVRRAGTSVGNLYFYF